MRVKRKIMVTISFAECGIKTKFASLLIVLQTAFCNLQVEGCRNAK